MTIKRLRELFALAQRIGAELSLQFSGRICVDGIEEPEDQRGIGAVNFWHRLDFVGDNDPDGPGWEHFSADDVYGLSTPMFILESGEEVGLKAAKALDATRATEPAGTEGCPSGPEGPLGVAGVH